MFIVADLVSLSRENIASFLCLQIILKWTLDYFYDGSYHNESRTDCKSCHVHTFLFRVAYYGIRGILWLYTAHCLLVRQRKTVDASVLNHNGKMQFYCNGLTLSERNNSTSAPALETEIIVNLISLTVDTGVVSSLLTWSHIFLELDHEIISQ